LDPGPPAPQAGILDQARRRPHSAVQRPYVEGRIINTLIRLKNNGKAESTLKHVSYRLTYLARHCDLNNAEEVCRFIAEIHVSNAYRDTFVKSYSYYAKLNGLVWEKPSYKSERKIPKIPSTEALMKVISATPKKYATIFRILMETGLMPYELAHVSLRDIDLDKGTLAARGFKGHSSRAFKLKSETLAMLKEYVQKYYKEYPFPDADWMGKIWRRIRNRTAEKLKEPSIGVD